jgi:hypothetical protein
MEQCLMYQVIIIIYCIFSISISIINYMFDILVNFTRPFMLC